MDLIPYYQKFLDHVLSWHRDHKPPNFPFNEEIIFNGDDFPLKGREIAVFSHHPQWQRPDPLYHPQTVLEHGHDFFEFIYVYRGVCDMTVDHIPFALAEGDLCLMNLQSRHSIRTRQSDQTVVFNIMVRPSFLDHFFLKINRRSTSITAFFSDSFQARWKESHYLLFHRTATNCIYETILHAIIATDFENRPNREEQIRWLFTVLLTELTSLYQEHLTSDSLNELKTRDISEIVQYILDHYDTVNLTSLSEHFGYTSKHLSELLKKYAGKTFSDILHSIRFSMAAQLLCDTAQPVQEIILRVGYSNSTWFMQKFRERYGCTPAQYRRTHRKTA